MTQEPVDPGRRPSVPALILLAPIRFYQRFITPYTPATCRYYPTCSAYAATALREHGALRGSWLAVRRLGRCHPWSEGGIDHVPARRERRRGFGSSTAGGRTAQREVRSPDRTSLLTGSMSDGSLGDPALAGRQSAADRPTEESTAA